MNQCKCGAPIKPRNKSGLCRPCVTRDPAVNAKKGQLTDEQRAARSANAKRINADPVVIAKRAVSLRRVGADPEYRARLSKATRNAKALKMANDPAFREALSQIGREVGAKNAWTMHTPEARAKAGRAISAARMAWCPEKYWPLNQTLKRKGLRLEARQEAIRGEVLKPFAPAAAHYLRRISPITQCTEDGRPSALGRWWLYAGVLRSAAQIVRLAEVKGWKPPEDLASVA